MIFEKIRTRLEKLIYDKSYLFNREDRNEDKYFFQLMCLKDEIMPLINQVEAEYNSGWISVDDETLAVGCKYLVVDEKNDVYIAKYCHDNVFVTRDKDYFMPIRIEGIYCQLLPLPPQPPKGE